MFGHVWTDPDLSLKRKHSILDSFSDPRLIDFLSVLFGMERLLDNGTSDVLAKAFRVLPTRESQRAAYAPSVWSMRLTPLNRYPSLYGLTRCLSAEQVRELRQFVCAINIECDIVSNIPLELVQRIFQYLPINQAFRCQRVSMNWHRLLSAPQTTASLMRPWFFNPESTLSILEGLSIREIDSCKAEYVDAWKNATPF